MQKNKKREISDRKYMYIYDMLCESTKMEIQDSRVPNTTEAFPVDLVIEEEYTHEIAGSILKILSVDSKLLWTSVIIFLCHVGKTQWTSMQKKTQSTQIFKECAEHTIAQRRGTKLVRYFEWE